MEARVGNSAVGVAPLAYHSRLGVVTVEHFSYAAPDLGCGDFFVVVFNKRIRHIDAEAVGALVKPEAHYRLDSLCGCKAVGMVAGQLPFGVGYLVKAVVERGLRAEIVYHIVAVALADSAHHAVFGRSVPHGFCEDVAV